MNKHIPVTKEILEKNGYNIGMYSILRLDDYRWLEYYHHEHRLRMWCSTIDEWDNHQKEKSIIFQSYIFYVDELEMAYKLCYIDKEISL